MSDETVSGGSTEDATVSGGTGSDRTRDDRTGGDRTPTRPAKGSPEEKAAMLAWLDEAADLLGIDRAVVAETLGDVLHLTGTVAHDRSRPAAPVTAFLVGLATGRAGGDSDGSGEAADTSATVATARQLLARVDAHAAR